VYITVNTNENVQRGNVIIDSCKKIPIIYISNNLKNSVQISQWNFYSDSNTAVFCLLKMSRLDKQCLF